MQRPDWMVYFPDNISKHRLDFNSRREWDAIQLLLPTATFPNGCKNGANGCL